MSRSGESTRRIGAIHADTIWKVDATNSVDNETTRNNGSTSQKTNLVSDLTSYTRTTIKKMGAFQNGYNCMD